MTFIAVLLILAYIMLEVAKHSQKKAGKGSR